MGSHQNTVEQLDYRPMLKVVNAAAAVLARTPLHLADLDMDSLLRAARRSTGLRDFGDDAFRGRLTRLLDEARDAPLTPLARVITRQAFTMALGNRLRVTDYLRRHPEVSRIPIERPVFVLGFPRSGTTVLQHLLSVDEGHRALRFWELTAPVPVHDDPQVDARRRRRKAQLTIRLSDVVAPEQHQIHHISADTAEECWPLFYTSIAAMNFDLGSGFRHFGDWLVDQDMTGPYREYKQQLQIMAHRQPDRRFVLKCPEHLWFIDAILEVFPDAAIVWTHRDPLSSVASYCSLISLNHRMLYGHIDRPAIGKHIADRFHMATERAWAARQRHDPSHFFDADFTQIVANPAGMARRIRQHFGMPSDDRVQRQMQDWLDHKRPDAIGQHHYSPEQWSLDPAHIYELFADYVQRFHIATRLNPDGADSTRRDQP